MINIPKCVCNIESISCGIFNMQIKYTKIEDQTTKNNNEQQLTINI